MKRKGTYFAYTEWEDELGYMEDNRPATIDNYKHFGQNSKKTATYIVYASQLELFDDSITNLDTQLPNGWLLYSRGGYLLVSLH